MSKKPGLALTNHKKNLLSKNHSLLPVVRFNFIQSPHGHQNNFSSSPCRREPDHGLHSEGVGRRVSQLHRQKYSNHSEPYDQRRSDHKRAGAHHRRQHLQLQHRGVGRQSVSGQRDLRCGLLLRRHPHLLDGSVELRGVFMKDTSTYKFTLTLTNLLHERKCLKE